MAASAALGCDEKPRRVQPHRAAPCVTRCGSALSAVMLTEMSERTMAVDSDARMFMKQRRCRTTFATTLETAAGGRAALRAEPAPDGGLGSERARDIGRMD